MRALATPFAGVFALACIAAPAHASESGASFYLLGSGGLGAAIMRPLPGVFFDNTAFFYSGKGQGERQFLVGGNLVAGLDVEEPAQRPFGSAQPPSPSA